MSKFKVGDELKYRAFLYTITILEVLGRDYKIKVNINMHEYCEPKIWTVATVDNNFTRLTKLEKAMK